MTAESLPQRRLRFLLVAIGTRGDVQPMIALAQVLESRGHFVRLAAPPEFEQWVGGHGLQFVPVGKNVQQFLAANRDVLTGSPGKAMAGWRKFWEDFPLIARQLCAAGQDMDAIAWAGLSFAASSVAEHLKIPALGVIYSTSVVPSGMHPPIALPWQTLPRWVNRLLWLVNHMMGERMLGPALQQARAQMGLPPISVLKHLFEQSHYVIATDEELFPTDPAWGEHFQRANYIFYDDPLPLEPELLAWLDAGEPPLFVDFGSMSGAGTERAARVVVQALAGTGRRCLIGAALAASAGQELPPSWRVVRAAPHAKLFPRVAAVVHHGGSGTTANALLAGVPQVVLPLILDQYQHAHRLHLAGLAPRSQRLERVTAAELSQAIDTALAMPAGPRQRMAQRLRASDGRGVVARFLESTVAGGSTGARAAALPAGVAAVQPAG